ncbi:MAG: hypothetical protein PHD43_16185 [Methylococcales bacterium]|nr:hypothetical protein [Methylococcales bacterium]
MQTLYKLEPDELNENFLQTLKLLFAGKTVEISVREVSPADEQNDMAGHPTFPPANESG